MNNNTKPNHNKTQTKHCIDCGVITEELFQTKTKSLCKDCYEEFECRINLIKYICNKQNLRMIHPHIAKQIKELHDEEYTYKELLFFARFYYEIEEYECEEKYSHTIAWMKSRAIPNAEAYMELNDLTPEDIDFEYFNTEGEDE
jgi:hypothetical protein